MSFKAMAWAVEQTTGSCGAKAVLMVLADNASGAEESCYPGQRTIADQTEQSERSVRTHMAHLESLGLIKRERRTRADGTRTSDLCTLNLSALPGLPANMAGGHQPATVAGPTGNSRQDNRQLSPDLPATVAGQEESLGEPLEEPLDQETKTPAPAPPAKGKQTPPGFAEFWSAYPRRQDKQDAIRAWSKAVQLASPAEITAAAATYAADPNREDQFTKLPATWLDKGAWSNDPLPARTNGRPTATAKALGWLALDDPRPAPQDGRQQLTTHQGVLL